MLSEDEYSASIQDFQIFKYVAEDLISQRVQPILPHKLCQKIDKGKNQYIWLQENQYLAENIMRSIDSTISDNCFVGKSLILNEGVQLIRSSIGNECKIAKNSIIANSTLLNFKIFEKKTFFRGCFIEFSDFS